MWPWLRCLVTQARLLSRLSACTLTRRVTLRCRQCTSVVGGGRFRMLIVAHARLDARMR